MKTKHLKLLVQFSIILLTIFIVVVYREKAMNENQSNKLNRFI